ncbi:hypothetical protein D0Z70_22515 [Sphingobium terrigena]|uniref:Tape measure protein N-terminal domain-containing protein n=1 Tax=Sphingobium terrigena TaxID=2304063 RepID=A0A418YLH1_9SPHN|nr:tape measure protein [Sphingobium terrigena]RJG51806.1 hypothetical protein D0Z70_22515 [Sphingobium terrigena]
MTVVAEDVLVRIRADMSDLKQKMGDSAQVSDRALNKIIGSSAKMEKAIRSNSQHAGASIKALAASVGGYFTGRELVGLLDGFTRLQNNLRVAGLEGENLKSVQDKLFATGQRYGISVETLAALFGKATQASSELGASQEQILQLTSATSAALKIQGTTAEQAQGSLLQLAQALQTGTVRAEEFNSVQEGLFPLLQAAANGSSRFGGSVARLTALVKDGKVSSKEFFDAILSGSEMLEGKAAKATLTLSAGYTTLTNALTVYFGEADKANGVSAALGETLKKVADNLDTLIPAIALIATAVGVNYTISAINAANATAALSGGLTVLQRLPVVAAITAIAAAIVYVGTESARTEARLANLNSNFDSLSKKVEGATSRAIAAGQNINIVGNASVTAAGQVDKLGRAFQSAAGQAATLAAQAKIATLAMIGTERTKTRTELGRLEQQQRTSQVVGNTFGYLPIDYISGEKGRRAARQDRRQGQIDELRQRLAKLDQLESQAVQVDPASFIDPAKPTAPAPDTGTKKARGKGASGPSAEEISRQYSQDLRAIVARDLQSRLAVASGANDRAELEHRLLNDEIRSAEDQIATNKEYSGARKAKLLAELKSYETSERARIEKDRADGNAELVVRDLADQRATMEAGADLLLSRKDRLAAENRILDLVEEQERKELEIAIANGQIADAAGARARLGMRQAARRTDANRKGASPMEAYIAGAQNDLENMGDRIEQVQVNALDRLTDGIARAGSEYLKLGGIAGDVINGIISDLIRLAAKQLIVAAFGGGGGGGAIASPLPGTRVMTGCVVGTLQLLRAKS